MNKALYELRDTWRFGSLNMWTIGLFVCFTRIMTASRPVVIYIMAWNTVTKYPLWAMFKWCWNSQIYMTVETNNLLICYHSQLRIPVKRWGKKWKVEEEEGEEEMTYRGRWRHTESKMVTSRNDVGLCREYNLYVVSISQDMDGTYRTPYVLYFTSSSVWPARGRSYFSVTVTFIDESNKVKFTTQWTLKVVFTTKCTLPIVSFHNLTQCL